MSGTFGGSSGTVNTQGTSTPWSGVQPYLLDAFQKAQANYGASQAPNSLTSQAQGTAGSIMATPLNPSANSDFKASVQDALGQAGSAFAGQYGGPAGTNLGNSGYQESLARGLGATATNAYANQYNSNVAQHLTAAGLAPSLQAAPLDSYIKALSGYNNGQTTNQTPYFTNPLASLLGAGVGLGALNSAMGGSGLIGGALSGIKGLLGLNTGSSLLNGFSAANPGLVNMGFNGDATGVAGPPSGVPEDFGGGFESGSGPAAAAEGAGGWFGAGPGIQVAGNATGLGDASTWGSGAADAGAGAAGIGAAGLAAFAFPGLFALNDMFDKGDASGIGTPAGYSLLNGTNDPTELARWLAAMQAPAY